MVVLALNQVKQDTDFLVCQILCLSKYDYTVILDIE